MKEINKNTINFIRKLKMSINSKYFFILILFLFIGYFYLYKNIDKDINALSSDVWMYQYVMIQEKEGQPWSDVPPLFNQERFYLAYPILYSLNPGLESNMLGYLILAISIAILICIINGLIVKKLFNSWLLATLAILLFIIPRYILPTHIGMLGFRNLRGLALVFPFYLLLSHYWVIYGIKNKVQNVALATLAAFCVYLYPPMGIIIIPFFILTALIIYKRKYFKQIFIFSLIYIAISGLFWYGHFNNPYSGQIDVKESLNSEQLELQAQIINYRVGDISLRDIDFGTLKRSIWDGFPLLALFILSLFLVKKYKGRITPEQYLVFKINIYFTVVFFTFIVFIEVVNLILDINGKPPFFIEHLRLMRAVGFLWIMQSILVIFILFNILNKKVISIIISIVLLLLPIAFSKEIIRIAVRAMVPLSIREEYNLAPIVLESEINSFKNLQDVSLWAREYLPSTFTKVFVYKESQNGFKFKVMSRKNTNLTIKEGALFYSSGFENSKRWYEERMRYNKVTEEATDFGQIIAFAKELNCTHMLLPRGKFQDLFEVSRPENTIILYVNKDYKLLEID